jgi:CRP/FNR family transcriptional regulator, anaerobic regulatory protein
MGAFMPVNAEELKFIEAFRTSTTAVKAGATILHEQKPNGKLFTLYSGWAFRYKTLSDGRRQILNFLLPGDFIGLQQKFADGPMHGIEAVTDASLCVFPREGLWELFRNFPNLGYDITWLAARDGWRRAKRAWWTTTCSPPGGATPPSASPCCSCTCSAAWSAWAWPRAA